MQKHCPELRPPFTKRSANPVVEFFRVEIWLEETPARNAASTSQQNPNPSLDPHGVSARDSSRAGAGKRPNTKPAVTRGGHSKSTGATLLPPIAPEFLDIAAGAPQTKRGRPPHDLGGRSQDVSEHGTFSPQYAGTSASKVRKIGSTEVEDVTPRAALASGRERARGRSKTAGGDNEGSSSPVPPSVASKTSGAFADQDRSTAGASVPSFLPSPATASAPKRTLSAAPRPTRSPESSAFDQERDRNADAAIDSDEEFRRMTWERSGLPQENREIVKRALKHRQERLAKVGDGFDTPDIEDGAEYPGRAAVLSGQQKRMRRHAQRDIGEIERDPEKFITSLEAREKKFRGDLRLCLERSNPELRLDYQPGLSPAEPLKKGAPQTKQRLDGLEHRFHRFEQYMRRHMSSSGRRNEEAAEPAIALFKSCNTAAERAQNLEGIMTTLEERFDAKRVRILSTLL